MSSATSLLVPAAQVLGITTSGILTGFGYAFSTVFIPVMLKTCPQDALARQWKEAYEFGKAAAPPMALVSAICFGFLATQSRQSAGLLPDWSRDPTAPWALYTLAAVAVPTIVPYTLLVMMPTTVGPLLAEADKPGKLAAETMRSLIVQWAQQNNTRQFFGLVGNLAGLAATLLR